MRWLHIYVSMFGLAAVLFFGVTGLTLNHPDWLFGTTTSSMRARGSINPSWVRPGPVPEAEDEVAKLEVVEHLRAAHGIRGAMTDFRVDETECLVTFKGPGYSADAFIDRETGRYDVSQTYHGAVAVLNDLHKGRDSGPVWSIVIDLSAIVMAIISATGLVLVLYLKLRRLPGLFVALLGALAVAAAYALGVP